MAKVVTALRSIAEKGVSAEKVALITGGTSGIGAATARRIAELGAKVVITGRRQHEGWLLVREIRRNGGCATFFRADLSRPEEARRVVPFTIETFGHLDYAFNNAGAPASDRECGWEHGASGDSAGLGCSARPIWIIVKISRSCGVPQRRVSANWKIWVLFAR